MNSREAIAQQISAATKERMHRVKIDDTPQPDSVELKSQIAHALAATEKRIATANNLKLAYDLLKEVEGSPATTKPEQRIKAACVARIKKHCFAIQQGLPQVPTVSANQQASMNRARMSNPTTRAERIAHLKNLLEVDAPAAFPNDTVLVFEGVDTNRLAVQPRNLALASELVMAEIQDAVRELRQYEILRLQYEDHLDPALAEEVALRGINVAKTPAELQAARQNYTVATEGRKGSAGVLVIETARQALLRAAVAPKAALKEVFTAVKSVLEGELQAAKFLEGEFFQSFGMRWQPTEVSSRILKAMSRLDHIIDGMKTSTVSASLSLNPNDTALNSFLGVRFDQ
jgi:hypothetical protein